MSGDHVFEVSGAETPYQLYLPNSGSDHIQAVIVKTASPYEHEMLQDMASRVEQGAVVVDVGANVGNHTLYLACVARARLWAFEPSREMAECITRSAALNNVGDRVTVVPLAVGARHGPAHLVIEDPNNLGGARISFDGDNGEPVEIITLDDFDFPDKVAAVKIDVEGMEMSVLEGAVTLIERHRPALYIESLGVSDFERLSAWFRDKSYVYWATFNASPTNLFLPMESLDDSAVEAMLMGVGAMGYQTRDIHADLETKLRAMKRRNYRQAHEIEDYQAEVRKLNDDRNRLSQVLEFAEIQRGRSEESLSSLKESRTYRAGAAIRDVVRVPDRVVGRVVEWIRQASRAK